MRGKPIAIAEDGKFAFLSPSPVPGDAPQVVSIWGQEGFRFRTFQGRMWELPSADRLESVCNLNRFKVADNEYAVNVRDAHGVDLNNLAALYICQERDSEAWGALSEAEHQFVAISGFFPRPPAPALLDRAVVLYNFCIIEWAAGNPSEGEALRLEACELMATVPAEDRDLGYGFVASALNCPTD